MLFYFRNLELLKMSILVLGHKGLLGSATCKILLEHGYSVETTDFRWPSDNFINYLNVNSFDWIINCAADIDGDACFSVNYCLPMFLSTLQAKQIYPMTITYDNTLYSQSKEKAYQYLVDRKQVYIIIGSILGINSGAKRRSLLEWFVQHKDDAEIFGFTNEYWLGFTVDIWADICIQIIQGGIKPRIIMPNQAVISKYELLLKLKLILNGAGSIIPRETSKNHSPFLKEYHTTVSKIDTSPIDFQLEMYIKKHAHVIGNNH